MEWLTELDKSLFHFINSELSSTFLDEVMPILTDLHKQPLFWILIAGAVAAFILRSSDRKATAKRFTQGLIMVALSMSLSDLIAYRAVKVWVQRDRPEAAGLAPILRTHSHSGWSFPSNHAANNFALARTIQILAPQFAIPAYAFASTVAISRVYVGVHYPGDIAGGALIGWLCASLVGFASRRWSEKWRSKVTNILFARK